MQGKSSKFGVMAMATAIICTALIIFAALLWWRFGWQRAVIPGTAALFLMVIGIGIAAIRSTGPKPSNSGRNQTETVSAANSVIRAYSDLVAKARSEAVPVRSVDELPYDKLTIKKSLQAVLMSNTSADMKKHMQFLYLELSRWQSAQDDEDDDSEFSETTEFMVKSVLAHSDKKEDKTRAARIERGILKLELQKILDASNGA